METLVQKWRKTRNTPMKSSKKLRSSLRLNNQRMASSKKKPIILFSDSSMDEELQQQVENTSNKPQLQQSQIQPQQKFSVQTLIPRDTNLQKYIIEPGNDNNTDISSLTNSYLENMRKYSIPSQNNIRQKSVRTTEQNHLLESKNPLNFQIDDASYKILDVFKYGQQLTEDELFKKIKTIIQNLIDAQNKQFSSIKEQITQLKQQTKKAEVLGKASVSSKRINEMYFVIKNLQDEKNQLEKDNERKSARIYELQTQNATRDKKMDEILKTQEMSQIKFEFILIMKYQFNQCSNDLNDKVKPPVIITNKQSITKIVYKRQK